MKANRQTQNAAPVPPDAVEWLANFLALKQQFQALEAENADWNLKKASWKQPRRWSRKRQLAPPAATVEPARPSGAQQGNTNRLKHGNYSRERLLFYAMVRTHIQAGRALIASSGAPHRDRLSAEPVTARAPRRLPSSRNERP